MNGWVVVAFFAGALVWPVTQLLLMGIDTWNGLLTFRRVKRRRVMEREELEKRRALGENKMTIEEWETYYGPLPTDREMQI